MTAWRWPDSLETGPKTIEPFAPCACGRYTWVRYGGVPACYWCASGTPPPNEIDLEASVIFRFNSTELDKLKRLAAARGNSKRKVGVQTKKIDQQRSDEDIDYLSVRAHYAITRWAGIVFDDSVTVTGGEGYLVRMQGRVIQVRSTAHRQGHLIYNTMDDVGRDLMVLCVPQAMDEGISAVGWIDRAAFIAEAAREDFGYGRRLSMPQVRLRSMAGWPLVMPGPKEG